MTSPRVWILGGLAGLLGCIAAWSVSGGAEKPGLLSGLILAAPVALALLTGLRNRGRTWSGSVALLMVAYVTGTITETIANDGSRMLAVVGALFSLAAFIGACVSMRATSPGS